MRWLLPTWFVGCGWFSAPEVVDTGDSHDHSTHEHSAVWPEDTGTPAPGDWRWTCTEAWEAGSDLVGTWDAEVSTEGRLVALQDYNGCQAVFTHRRDDRTHAYLALLRANVVQDLGQRHGQPPQATEQLSETADGTAGDADSTAVAMAAGGMVGGIVTSATNLVVAPGTGNSDALVFEVELGGRKVDLRAWSADSDTSSAGVVGEVAFSGDGEWVVVSSTAPALDPEVGAGQGYQLYAQRTRQPA